MKMHQKIKELRTKKGLTQVQVADYLGVSASAVNKWEKNSSYPDITILPALARLLNTDLNSLMDFKEDLTEREIALFLNELSEIKDFDSAYKRVKDKIYEYPNCESLILNSMILLDGMNSKDNLDNEDIIISYYRRFLESRDLKIKVMAYQMLINHEIKRGCFEEAQNLIEEIPDNSIIKRQTLRAKLKYSQKEYEEASKIIEEMVFQEISSVLNNLTLLQDIYLEQDNLEMTNFVSDIIMETSKLYQMEYVGLTSKLSIEVQQNKVRTLLYLGKLIKLMSNFQWDSKLYVHMTKKGKDDSFKKMFIDAIKKDNAFDFIREEKEFKEIIK